jgi:hypothetical protein
MTSKPGSEYDSGMEPGGSPLIGQVMSGMEAARARSAAFEWNRRRHARTLPAKVGDRGEPVSERSVAGDRVPVVVRADGLACSSAEGSVMGLERRGQVVRDPFVRSTG